MVEGSRGNPTAYEERYCKTDGWVEIRANLIKGLDSVGLKYDQPYKFVALMHQLWLLGEDMNKT